MWEPITCPVSPIYLKSNQSIKGFYSRDRVIGKGICEALQIIKKGRNMDIIKKMFQEMDDKVKYDIYLREIALLMEQIEDLKGQLRVKKKLIKSFELGLQGRKHE